MRALGSTYVASALATPVLVECLRGGTTHRFRLVALDARHVILGRRLLGRVRRRVQRESIAGLAPFSEQHLALAFQELAHAWKPVAQVSYRRAGRHVRQNCITWRLVRATPTSRAGGGLRSRGEHRRPCRAGIRRSWAAAPRLSSLVRPRGRDADGRDRPSCATTCHPDAVPPAPRG